MKLMNEKYMDHKYKTYANKVKAFEGLLTGCSKMMCKPSTTCDAKFY